ADIIYLTGWGAPVWNDVAFYTMAGGVVGALLAAPFGLLDFLTIRDPQTKRVGAAHMIINLLVVVLFAINLWLRTRAIASAGLPVELSVAGVLLLAISGWLGGEMVYVHGVGVEPPSARRETRIEAEARQHQRSA